VYLLVSPYFVHLDGHWASLPHMNVVGWAWWCTPVIPALGRLRQEDLEFEVSLSWNRLKKTGGEKKKRC
jgi:hypothetical protein